MGSLARGDTRGVYTQSTCYHCLSHLGKKYTLYVPIHRGALLHDYFQIQIHEDELQSSILIDETFSGLAMNFFFASLCKSDCSTLTALSIMFMVICSRPYLPPLSPRQFFLNSCSPQASAGKANNKKHGLRSLQDLT